MSARDADALIALLAPWAAFGLLAVVVTLGEIIFTGIHAAVLDHQERRRLASHERAPA